MSHATDHPIRCADTSCAAQHPSGKWSEIRAWKNGWYHDTAGLAWCPLHLPKWVQKRRRTK